MKQMIKGMDILLYSGDTAETVENVLVGNPGTCQTADLAADTGAIQTYTLAIPKGDTHDWVNRIVEFFGRKFRTVGVPIRGIEENIPLFWHSQVSVQRLVISGICTIYEGKSYARHVYDNAYYHDQRGDSVMTDGIASQGALHVQLYADKYREDNYCPEIGDIVVPGECAFVFDTSSQQAESASMRSFRESTDFAVISEVRSVSYGDIPDYILTAQ